LRLPENRGVPSSILGLAIQVLERSQRFGVGVQAVALLPEEGSIGATPASRASGDRRLNSALHKIAVRRGRWEPRARAYLEHRRAEGQARREALLCLKHHLVRVVLPLLRRASGAHPQLVLRARGGKVRVPAPA
jgi:hypothetical protein